MSTITFYESRYSSGAKIPLDEFPLWELRAEAELNRITFGRFEKLTERTDNILMCICECAEVLYVQSMRDGIASENNDGYSVTYEKGGANTGVYSAARRYLSGELLYRGYENDGKRQHNNLQL